MPTRFAPSSTRRLTISQSLAFGPEASGRGPPPRAWSMPSAAGWRERGGPLGVESCRGNAGAPSRR
eukprot:7573669-Lingulodinium_polyedra.AAC.1